MKAQRKAVAASAIAATIGLVLSACSAGDATPEETSSEPEVIMYWSNLGGMDAVAAKFNETHTDVQVVFEQVPAPEAGGYQKLSNALRAGNAPCVATVATSDLTSFVTQGAFLELDDLAGDVIESFPQSAQDVVQIGGSTWAIPQATGAMVWFYRQDVLDAAGVEVPETWEEFEEVSAAVQAVSPGTHLTTFVNHDIRFITGLVSQAGAQWFSTEDDQWSVDMTDPATMKVADYWQSLIDQGLVPVQAAGSAEWNNDLTTGKLAGFLGGPFNAAGIVALAPEQAGLWRVAPAPTWEDDAAGGFGGAVLGVTKDCEYVDAALEFIEWITTDPEAVEARSTKGSSYPAYPAQSAAAKEAFLTPENLAYFGGQDIYEVFDESAANQVPFVWGPTMPGTTSAVIEGYAKITSGGTLSEVFADAEEQTIKEMTELGLLD